MVTGVHRVSPGPIFSSILWGGDWDVGPAASVHGKELTVSKCTWFSALPRKLWGAYNFLRSLKNSFLSFLVVVLLLISSFKLEVC